MSGSASGNSRVTIDKVEVLSDDWSVLRKYHIRYRRSDGSEQSLTREVYDRGSGAVVLLYNRARRTVILTRQFRMPILASGAGDGMMLEAPAGLLDADNPEDAIRREAEEETGYRIARVEKLCEAFMSPGGVTERLYFFTAEYSDADKVGAGGGHAGEGEDIEVLEVPFTRALAMIDEGGLQDGKTILLLYAAKARGLFA